MLHVNNDNDDLFRKAAESYPLKTDGSDWGKVRTSLPGNTLNKGPLKDERKNRKRPWILFLLLIPSLWVSDRYIFRNLNTKGQHPGVTISVIPHKSFIAGRINNPVEFDAMKPTDVDDHRNFKSVRAGRFPDLNTKNNNYELNTILNQTSPGTTTPDSMNILSKSGIKLLKTHTRASIRITKPDSLAETMSSGIPPPTEENDSVSTGELKEEFPVDAEKNLMLQTKRQTKTSVCNQMPVVENNAKKKPAKTGHHFYAGLIVGADLSTIKIQAVKHIGTDIGIIVGFQFNNRLSLESGLLIDKKYYYTDGKYFDTKGIYLPATARIIDLSGDCKMDELPLNLKYNFKSYKKSQWFSTVGFSAYFMNKQGYNYNIRNNGNQYMRYVDYNTSSGLFFSVLNLGGGFTQNIGFVTLRVEPYIKIPLQGIGVGRLHITSSGLNIGFTKKF